MSGRVHSKPKRLATVILARIAGVGEAASVFGVDQDTVRSWVKGAEPVPEDAWAALDELAGAQLLEKMARGDIKNPVTLATVRGIAARNVRYQQVIAQRDARRAEAAPVVEGPSPVRVLLDRLDVARQRLMRDSLDLTMRTREPVDTPAEPRLEGDELPASMTALVEELLALSDDEVARRQAELTQALREIDRIERDKIEADIAARQPPALPDRIAAARNVTPTPEQAAEAVSAPRERVPMVLDPYRPDTWEPWQ